MKGLIYTITGYGLTYYGSTIQTLNDRRDNHKSRFKNKNLHQCSSAIILEKGDDWSIQVIEELDIDDIDELHIKESEYMKKNQCVNKNILKTKEELTEYKRIWAEKKRREKGCKLKSEMTKTKDPEYQKLKTREYRSKITPEEKEEHLKARREAYAKKPQTEEQKEKARERSRLYRERKRLGEPQ
jgi:hypothetical protein